MSARPPKCPGCAEVVLLRVYRYVPGDPVEVGYECLVCGVRVEHATHPVSADVLARYGFSTPAA